MTDGRANGQPSYATLTYPGAERASILAGLVHRSSDDEVGGAIVGVERFLSEIDVTSNCSTPSSFRSSIVALQRSPKGRVHILFWSHLVIGTAAALLILSCRSLMSCSGFERQKIPWNYGAPRLRHVPSTPWHSVDSLLAIIGADRQAVASVRLNAGVRERVSYVCRSEGARRWRWIPRGPRHQHRAKWRNAPDLAVRHAPSGVDRPLRPLARAAADFEAEVARPASEARCRARSLGSTAESSSPATLRSRSRSSQRSVLPDGDSVTGASSAGDARGSEGMQPTGNANRMPITRDARRADRIAEACRMDSPRSGTTMHDSFAWIGVEGIRQGRCAGGISSLTVCPATRSQGPTVPVHLGQRFLLPSPPTRRRQCLPVAPGHAR